ncbi:MAG TPA: hypothetical protein PKX27_04910 [Bacteroidales bacterium]|jgi:hypothetical protein|nr:hypothetical protein [Bacteroidales bacterium]HOX74712.1 hypothetical protein [Bacteroidales bacterium]HPM87302.1 hypothetical protein [Bacteroidales bacterium]HQM69500.1 hypothetical protein [Bacteroidales bacterium]
MKNKRSDHEQPLSTSHWGWKYHHLGIPTDKKMTGEIYLSQFKFYVSGFDSSPFGIEWMRFEKDSPISKLIQTVPHLAFEVKDIDYELANHDFKVISGPEENITLRSMIIDFPRHLKLHLNEINDLIKTQD